MIKRYYQNYLNDWVKPGKVFVLYGPRQVGKTTLINHFCDHFDGKVFRSTGEDQQMQDLFNSPSTARLKVFFEDYDLLFIDEAQLLNDVGLSLKLMVDHMPDLKIVVTGSSSFDLSNKIGEPLVGRQRIRHLYPFSMKELKEEIGWFDVVQRLEEFLVYGTYPEVMNLGSRADREEYLSQIRDSYLFENIKNSKKIKDLLRLIAFQVGNEVSHQELGQQLGMSKNTVARYLDLLEKAFVVINVRGFSRNLRSEIVKKSRYYFYDNGIRNALINNFNPLESRNDVGDLWENFLFIERMKVRSYKRMYGNTYFWRTYDQQEIDMIEEYDGKLHGYEFTYSEKKANKKKIPPAWKEAYPDAEFKVISKNNMEEFIL